jgi:hypothetical protein
MRTGNSPGRLESLPAPLRALLALLALLLAAACLAIAALLLTGGLGGSGDVVPDRIVAAAEDEEPSGDPFAYSDERRRDFVERATLGHSHVLYEKSPGGIVASARRTARFRNQIERAAEREGVDPDLMEAMVLLESAGRPDVIAGDDPEAASGLAQILAATGIDLLGMEIDLERSRRLTRRMARSAAEASRLRDRAARAGNPRRAARLRSRAADAQRRARSAERERAEIDARFDPPQALAGMARYLRIAIDGFGREDLGVAAYHMGIGNLTDVARRYVGPEGRGTEMPTLVEEHGLSFARLYFDSSPLRNEEAWELLAGFGDDSSTYLWRVLAAQEVMRLLREDREELERLAELHGAKATAEEVFHPEEETETFADAEALAAALEDGELVQIPAGRPYGCRIGEQLGEHTRELGVDRSLYRSLRPEAAATLIYICARVRAISDARRPLTLTSAGRDRAYQERLLGSNSEATAAYSLHTTGYAFDILRRYENGRQAEAFQFVLDRLRSLGVIDYAVEPQAIHVAVSTEGAAPLLE